MNLFTHTTNLQDVIAEDEPLGGYTVGASDQGSAYGFTSQPRELESWIALDTPKLFNPGTVIYGLRPDAWIAIGIGLVGLVLILGHGRNARGGKYR